MRYIITSQPEAFRLALSEAGRPKIIRNIEPGIALCEGVRVTPGPVFLRHICPVHAEIPLSGNENDLKALQLALAPLLHLVKSNVPFSVQTRIAKGFSPAYKPFDVNNALCTPVKETGAVLNVRQPGQVISVVLANETGWIGISGASENLHDWAGGARRFKWENGQISRAEFKLLEAAEQFGMNLTAGMRAVDLGAAPGGWTRVLRSKGLLVTAVDPADLDARLSGDQGIRHVKSTAQAYFLSPEPCDLLVNDMKMDALLSAAWMVEGASSLREGGEALMTIKLPNHAEEWQKQIHQVKSVLSRQYEVLRLRQLFHNRNEVTAYGKKRSHGIL